MILTILGVQDISISIGPAAHSCRTITCTVSTHCSEIPEQCLYNMPIDTACYSTAVGGSIDITIVKPSYAQSSLHQCSSSSSSELFNTQFYISSLPIPTPSPTLLMLPDNSSNLIGVKGAPFYCLAFVGMAMVVYGVALVRLRDLSDRLSSLKLSQACVRLGLFGLNITSEVAYVSSLFGYSYSSFKGYATVILVARFLHLPNALYIVSKLLKGGRGGEEGTENDKQQSNTSNHYLELMDKEHMLTNRASYVPLFILILLDNTNVQWLPWLSTKFSGYSDGFPDFYLYTSCNAVKVVQSFISALVQIAVLGKLNSKHNFNELSTDSKVS